MGHKNSKTTEDYILIDDDDLAAIPNSLSYLDKDSDGNRKYSM